MFPNYQLVLTRFFWIFTLWNSFLLNSSYAQTTNMCFEFLNGSNEIYINLPGRGNQITRAQFDALDSKLQYRLLALSDAMASLDEAEVISAFRNVNQPIDLYITPATIKPLPDELAEIIKLQSYAITVEEHFYYFSSVVPELPTRTLVGLSLLSSQIKRLKHITKTYIMTLNFSQSNASNKLPLFKQSIRAINQARFITTLIRFIKNENVQKVAESQHNKNLAAAVDDLLMELLNRIPPLPEHKIKEIINGNMKKAEALKLNAKQIENTFNRKKELSDNELSQLLTLLVIFSDILESHYISTIKPHNQTDFFTLFPDSTSRLGELPRKDRLVFMEDFLIEHFGFRDGLNDLVGLLDHLSFGSALPIKTEDLEWSIFQSLKSVLMPVRNAINQINTQNRIQSEIQNENLNPQILNPDWGYTPTTPKPVSVPNPNKRRNSPATQQPTLISSSNAIKIYEIPDNINLLHFTSSSDQQRPLTDLSENTIYQLRFMRNDKASRVYTIEFEGSAIDDLLEIPDIAHNLLRGLNLGFAKSIDEDGLKILKANKKGLPGRFYELKDRKSDIRVILHHDDGHWRFLKVTDKLNLSRVLKGYL